MDEQRARTVGVNEALFRAVNEQIESLNRRLKGPEDMEVVCECGSAQCVERVKISLDDYERVRKDPRRFIISPGHVEPEFETVIEEHEGYHFVEKIHEIPEQIAEQSDPRS
ncbi:MAG TPA: hypothetical protein VGU02_00865 [Gaiellaceae bacterium]|nr:hypothetical protein [Gaiellaceae bacterium]